MIEYQMRSLELLFFNHQYYILLLLTEITSCIWYDELSSLFNIEDAQSPFKF